MTCIWLGASHIGLRLRNRTGQMMSGLGVLDVDDADEPRSSTLLTLERVPHPRRP